MTEAEQQVLAPAWCEWLADNLAHGLDDEELFELLEARGVPRSAARAAADTIRRSPVFVVAQKQAVRAARLATALRLVRTRAAVTAIERRVDPTPEEFFGRYWAAGIPFVATDVVTRWPALGLWSPRWFRDQLGEVEIEASVGRDSDPDCDVNFAIHRANMTMAAYVDRVLAADTSNECYLIANNHNLARPGLRRLFDDIVPPAYIDAARLAGGSALWFGPAGTVTSLHHDTSNILLCQVYGSKRVLLGDPCDAALLDHARGVYSEIDPTATEGRAQFHLVELGPGDALFLPVGWWHHVTAHEVSITIALNAFVRPNRFDWYKPGALR